MKAKALSLLCSALLTTSASAQLVDLGPWEIAYPTTGAAALGEGWSWPQATAVSTCITGPTGSTSNLYQKVSFSQVTDTSTFNHALSIDASAKMKYLVGSASASFHFADSVEKDGYHEIIIAKVDVFTEQDVVSPTAPTGTTAAPIAGFTPTGFVNPAEINLAPKNLALAKIGSPPMKFLNKCGDGFVSQINRGGSLVIYYDFTTHSEKERQDIAANVSGSYGSVSASLSVTNTLQTYADNNQLKIEYASLGGTGQPVAISLADITQMLKNFPEQIQNHPAYITASISPYSVVANWPSPTIENRVELENAIFDRFLEFQYIEQQAQKIALHLDDYTIDSATSVAKIQQAQTDAGKYSAALKAAYLSCMKGVACVMPSIVPKDDYNLRATLPVKNEGSEFVNTLAKARANLDAAKKSLAADPATQTYTVYRNSFIGKFGNGSGNGGGGSSSSTTTRPNPAIAIDTAAVAKAQTAYDAAEKDLDSNLIKERLTIWVADIAQARCDDGIEEPCFDTKRLVGYSPVMAEIPAMTRH